MLAPLLACWFLPQAPDLDAVERLQAARVAVVARCAPAVCSVMAMDSPGGGSGVVIDPHGLVLTNFHVVGAPDPDYELPEPPDPPPEDLERWRAAHRQAEEGAEKAFVEEWKAAWCEENLPRGKSHYRNKKVGLPDGYLYEAEVLGIDPGSDLALLRLVPREEGQRWPSVPLGDSDDLLVGQMVLAMGNPFLLATDFTPTVTFGIVSGTHRYQEGQGNRMLVYPDCVQVDAPVNPGNSGGPLFNEDGEVVGINGRISIGDRGRVNVGVGFAIASNQIRNFLGDLMAGRHAEHGTLDMSAWYMTAPTGNRRGVFVQQLYRDSVAALAGIRLGDEITSFDGTAIRAANQLATLIGVLPAGTWVTVGYRPAIENGGFGGEKIATIRLAALDTGSSRDARADADRLASAKNRRLVATALLEAWFGTNGADVPRSPTSFSLDGPAGRRLRLESRGSDVRAEIGDAILVAREGGEAFAVESGARRAATVEERAFLDRMRRANPFLWTGRARRQLDGSLLAGGVLVDHVPAFRFELPGAGEAEAWYFEGGIPAGYAFRDPLRRAFVQVFFRPRIDGADLPRGLHWRRGRFARPASVLVVADGVQELGWKEGPPTAGGPDAMFEGKR
ncbi:MAG: hypothetical protein Fur0037_04210 [Planctomycetota bacterium]